MKKFIALALVLLMTAAVFAGCQSSQGSDDGSLSTVEKGKLIMATNAEFPPYEYIENNAVTGIDVEIAQAIANKLGLELVVENMEFDSIITSVKTARLTSVLPA